MYYSISSFKNFSFRFVFSRLHFYLGSDLSVTDFFREFLDMITPIPPSFFDEFSCSLSSSVCKKYVYRGFSKKFARFVLKRLDTSSLFSRLSSLDDDKLFRLFSDLGLSSFPVRAEVICDLVTFLIARMAGLSVSFPSSSSSCIFDRNCDLCTFLRPRSFFSFCSCCFSF